MIVYLRRPGMRDGEMTRDVGCRNAEVSVCVGFSCLRGVSSVIMPLFLSESDNVLSGC